VLFFGKTSLKYLQKVINNPERYDMNELLSLYFTYNIIKGTGFNTTSEKSLINALIFNKRIRYFYPDTKPLLLDEKTAKMVHPRMTVKGLEKLRDKILAKGLKIDI